SAFLMCGSPHAKTQRLRIIHGSQAIATCPFAKEVAIVGCVPSIGQISFGFQTFSSKAVAPSEEREATTSTSDGPTKFETRNCGIANASPAVSATGHTPIIPRKPEKAHATQNGTSTEKNGSCLPTIPE